MIFQKAIKSITNVVIVGKKETAKRQIFFAAIFSFLSPILCNSLMNIVYHLFIVLKRRNSHGTNNELNFKTEEKKKNEKWWKFRDFLQFHNFLLLYDTRYIVMMMISTDDVGRPTTKAKNMVSNKKDEEEFN